MRCSIPLVDSMQCNGLSAAPVTARFLRLFWQVPNLRSFYTVPMICYFPIGDPDCLMNKLNLRTMHPEKGSYCLMGRACQSAARARE
jgi:hypothetical protein